MTTLALALKDEIRRLARKEIKAQTGRTARAVAQYRREIARLKRQQREHEKKIAFLAAQARKTLQSPAAIAELNGDARFSSRSAKAQRQRTGLSAADYVKVISVQQLDAKALGKLAPAITTLARAEGLEAHARSVEVRLAN